MKCELCGGADATVHLTTVMPGKTTKIDLCEKCAKEHGVQNPRGFSMLDLLKLVEAKRGGQNQDPPE